MPAWPRFWAKRNNPQEPRGRSGRELAGWQRPSPSSSAAAPGPAAPGGPSRVTHGHGGVGGVKSAGLLSRPRADSHLLPSQVRIKQEENARVGMYTDNYAATHGRVSGEWRPRGGRRRETAHLAPPGLSAGPRKPARPRASNYSGATARARRGERTARRARAAPETPHGPSGLRPPAPPGSSGSRGASSPASRRSSDASAFHSPPTRTSLLPGRGWVLPLLSPGRVSSQSVVSPPPPPLFSPQSCSRLLSSPLKPTWRRRRRRRWQLLPERESGTRREHSPLHHRHPRPRPPRSPPRTPMRHYGDHPRASREV